MIPPDQALANKGLQASLEQIKNVAALSLPDLANTVVGIETNAGLPLITALTQAVPDSVRAVISSTVATGSGPNGTLVLGDVLGTASGYNITQPLSNTVAVIATMNTTALQNIYEVMANAANLQYGNAPVIIPIGEPGANTYANLDLAFANLISLANSNIAALTSQYPTQTSQLNNNWITIANVVISQQNSIGSSGTSGIDYANLSANQKSVIPSFVDSLHDYGLQIQPGGPNEFLVAVANVSTQTGQALIGCLREGRNLEKLNTGGVGVDSQIPSQ
jgi:hypothetical protein